MTPTTIDRFCAAITDASVGSADVFCDDVILDATVPNWHFVRAGKDAVRAEPRVDDRSNVSGRAAEDRRRRLGMPSAGGRSILAAHPSSACSQSRCSPVRLEYTRVVESDGVTHLRCRVMNEEDAE